MSVFVHCIFETPEQAAQAVQALVDTSFDLPDISLLAADEEHRVNLVGGRHTAVRQGLALGGLTGASVGLAWAAVSGFGIGLLAAGPILGALQAMSGGAVVGGLLGALGGLGYWKVDAEIPVTAIEKGGILVGVHVPDARIGDAAEVLRACGADLVHIN